ncbi:MAG: hypothetical protein Q4F17_01680 [Eubacteriales bacterium]|nr:hypothetical protein [Eubacteriales bacterium]
MQLSTLIKKALELLFSRIAAKGPAPKSWKALSQGQKEGETK